MAVGRTSPALTKNSYNVFFATLAEGYNKNEIARAQDCNYLTVNVSLRIVSFLEVEKIFFIIYIFLFFIEVDEIGQTLKVVLCIRRTWFDSRLTWLHVKEDRDMNVL